MRAAVAAKEDWGMSQGRRKHSPAFKARGALIGWLRIRQHDSLADAYTVGSHDLASISATADSIGDEETWEEFVGRAEESFSREHSVWVYSRFDRFSLG